MNLNFSDSISLERRQRNNYNGNGQPGISSGCPFFIPDLNFLPTKKPLHVKLNKHEEVIVCGKMCTERYVTIIGK